MVAAVIAYPKMVTGGIDQGVQIDADKALETMGMPGAREAPPAPTMGDQAPAPAPASNPASEPTSSKTEAAEDPMKALLDAVKKDGAASGAKP